MAKITVEYFTLTDFNSSVASTVVRLSSENKLSISFLKDKFLLKTVEEIEDGIAVGIPFDASTGYSDASFANVKSLKITGEPKGIFLC